MNVLHFGLSLLQVVADLKTVFGDWVKTPLQAFDSMRGENHG